MMISKHIFKKMIYVCIGSYIIVLPISCMTIADEISKNEYTKYYKYYSHLHIEFYAA